MLPSLKKGWKVRNKKAGSKTGFLSEKGQSESDLFQRTLINAFWQLS
jgi:hypothetical protein